MTQMISEYNDIIWFFTIYVVVIIIQIIAIILKNKKK
jgi:hypothetical protein